MQFSVQFPRFAVLNRLNSFIPSMRTANEELKRKIELDGPESVNLLVVPDGEQHIEMVSLHDRENAWLGSHALACAEPSVW